MNAVLTPPVPDGCSGMASQGLWQLAWASVAGSRHVAAGKSCEDTQAYRLHPDGAVTVACADGVSGGAVGDVASAAAARHCTDWDWPANAEDAPAALQAHVHQLDETVRQAVARHTARTGATTLVAAWLKADGSGWLAQVGDVRAYLWTPPCQTGLSGDDGLLECLTRDETYSALAQLPPNGVPADNPARMLGNGSAPTPALQPLSMEPGQTLLLCTDGLHGFMSDREMAQALGTGLGARVNPALMARTPRRLLRLAIENGSDDDIAVMLLHRRPINA